MTHHTSSNTVSPTPGEQAITLVERIEVLGDKLLQLVPSHNPHYAETPPLINELYVRLGELRPLIDQLLGNPAEDQWPNVPASPSNSSDWGPFLFGIIVGVIGAMLLANT